MKIDKETLIKHRFWLGLAVAVPMVLLAIFVLLTFVSAEIARVYQKRVQDAKTITDLRNAKNQKNVSDKEAEAKRVEAEKNKVWAKLYQTQKDRFPWPRSFERKFDFQGGLFALEVKVVSSLPKNDAKANPSQFAGEIVDLDLYVNEITVQAKDGEKKRFLRAGISKVMDGRGGAAVKDTKDKKAKGKDKNPGKDQGKERTPREEFENLEKGDLVVVTMQRGRYFNEALTEAELRFYGESAYDEHLAEIVKLVEPLDQDGHGVIDLGGWRPGPGDKALPPEKSEFLHRVKWKNLDKDFSKEAWAAQEDLWLQGEMFRCVKKANDYVSKFDYLLPCQGKGGENEATFDNANWKLEMELQKDELKLTLSHRRAKDPTMDQKFLVQFSKDGPPEEIVIPAKDLFPEEDLRKSPGDAKKPGEKQKTPVGKKGEKQKTPVGKKAGDKTPLGKKDQPKEKWPVKLTVELSKGRARTGIYAVTQVVPWEAVGSGEAEQGGVRRDTPFVFRNPYWHLELTLRGSDDDGAVEVKIANQLPRRQKIEQLKFKILFNKGEPPQEIVLGGVPLEPKDESGQTPWPDPEAKKDPKKEAPRTDRTVKIIPLEDLGARTGIYGVEQVLTPETAAVRAIEQVKIGALSQPMSGSPLRGFAQDDAAKKNVKEDRKDKNTKKGQKGVEKKKDPAIPGIPGKGGKSADRFANGVQRDRYLDVTEQFRRVPLGVVLVVDQDHVERVMTAFRNSPLRFKIAQMTLNRYSASAGAAGGGPKGGGPKLPPKFGPGRPQVPFFSGPGAKVGPIGPPGKEKPKDTRPSVDEADISLELVLYGEVTLYNRYPPAAHSGTRPPTPQKK